MTAAANPKRTRYIPGGARGLRLTPRDVEIVRLVSEHRVLRTDQIGRLLELIGFDASGIETRTGQRDSAKKIRDRLTELFHGGLLTRPRTGFSFAFPGSEPLVYAVGRDGERLVQNRQGAARKMGFATRGFLEHQLLTNDIVIALREAAAVRSDLELAIGAELIGEHSSAHPVRFSVDVNIGSESRRVGLEPDLAFTLADGDRTQAYFVEVDRDTEPAVRSRHVRGSRAPTLAGTSILRKLLAYVALKKSDAVRDRLGWRNFKVLFVCEPRPGGGDRIERIMDVVRRHLPQQAGLFLFVTAGAIGQPDILGLDWRDANGTVTRLAPSGQQRTT